MSHRKNWVNDSIRRQDNIDPIRRIPNVALFQGTLIKGSLRLNPAQRIGALIVALTTLLVGCLGLVHFVKAVHAWNLSDPYLLLAFFSPVSFWFGWRIVRNAVINDPSRTSKKS